MKFIIDASCIKGFAATLSTMAHSRRIVTSTRKISNLNDVTQAVKDIYYHPNTLWAHARGGRGVHKRTDIAPFCSQVDKLLNDIGNRIYNYFNKSGNTDNNQKNFDVFHESLCDIFLSEINMIRRSAGVADMSYGQAQKLINLSFKYLTTYSDYLEFADLFSYCHMVIDAIVLANLNSSNVSRILGVTLLHGIPRLSGTRFNGKGWTAFSKDDYLSLLEKYRILLDPYLGCNSYMQVEYHMWPTCSRISFKGIPAKSITKFYH